MRSLVNRVELACREPDQVETDESEHMDRSGNYSSSLSLPTPSPSLPPS